MIDEDFSSNINVIQLGLDLLPFPLPSLSCHDLTLETYERKIRTFFNTNVQRFTLFIEIETILIFSSFFSILGQFSHVQQQAFFCVLRCGLGVFNSILVICPSPCH